MKILIKIIEEYPNYTISSNGCVTNINTNKILKVYINQGRAMVELWKNNKKKHCSVHRLIAIAFIPNEHNKPQVNHIDGNPLNNSIENLEWVTDSENKFHAYRTGLKKAKRMPVIQYTLNGDIVKKHDSILNAYKETNINRHSIQLNILNKYKQAGGYIWKKEN